jgi:uncharacterized coiled-coil protein SlyX
LVESEGCVVTWLNDDIEYEPLEEPDGKRRVAFIVSVLVLAIIGSGSAFAWRSYAGAVYPFLSLGSSPAVATEPEKVGLAEFQAFQQQIAGQIQTSAQVLATQQEDLKRLSEQVAAVSTKMEALQSSIASARAALPTPTAAKNPTKPKSSAVSTRAVPLPPPVKLTP